MRHVLLASAMAAVASLAPAAAHAEFTLVARYDWMDGAKDVAGGLVPHDGVIESGASAVGGALTVSQCAGVIIEGLVELSGASKALLRFEDVAVNGPSEGATGRYSALAGGGNMDSVWWAALVYELPPSGNRTKLRFNLGGWDAARQEVEVVVAEDVVTRFDSLEYRFDGTAPPEERIGFRWNGGPWVLAGWSDPESFRTLPVRTGARINAGCQADWDHLNAVMGPVSFYVGTASSAGLVRPGDGTGDGRLDISDPILLLGILFLGEDVPLPCGGDHEINESGNIALLDSNGDGAVDLSDSVQVLVYLFMGGPPPVLGGDCTPVEGCQDLCF